LVILRIVDTCLWPSPSTAQWLLPIPLVLTLDAGQFAHIVDLCVCIKVGQKLDLHIYDWSQ